MISREQAAVGRLRGVLEANHAGVLAEGAGLAQWAILPPLHRDLNLGDDGILLLCELLTHNLFPDLHTLLLDCAFVRFASSQTTTSPIPESEPCASPSTRRRWTTRSSR